MLIIELNPLKNGAHRNQTWDAFVDVPEGWAEVPEELEAEAFGYLPFIRLTVENGSITGVEQGEIPALPIAPEPEPADPITQLQLSMAELAETMEASTTETQLAVAELAELMAAGEVSK